MQTVGRARTRALIEKAIVLKGSEPKLADACGVTQNAIWRAKRAGRVTDRLAIAIHRATEGAVPASMTRPDLWRRPEDVPIELNGARPRRRRKRNGARR